MNSHRILLSPKAAHKIRENLDMQVSHFSQESGISEQIVRRVERIGLKANNATFHAYMTMKNVYRNNEQKEQLLYPEQQTSFGMPVITESDVNCLDRTVKKIQKEILQFKIVMAIYIIISTFMILKEGL